jgi:hypothetical protein
MLECWKGKQMKIPVDREVIEDIFWRARWVKNNPYHDSSDLSIIINTLEQVLKSNPVENDGIEDDSNEHPFSLKDAILEILDMLSDYGNDCPGLGSGHPILPRRDYTIRNRAAKLKTRLVGKK